MGITIYYDTILDNKENVHKALDFFKKAIEKEKEKLPKEWFPNKAVVEIKRFTKIRDASEEEKKYLVRPDIGFTYEDLFNFVFATPTVTITEEGKMIREPGKYGKTDHCQGFIINVHNACEPIRFIFCKTDKGWVLDKFTKTQFCGLPGHLMVCKILEEAKKRFFPNMEIYDEAEFCGKEEKDIEKLRENFEENAILIDKFTSILKEAFGDENVVSGYEIALGKIKTESALNPESIKDVEILNVPPRIEKIRKEELLKEII